MKKFKWNEIEKEKIGEIVSVRMPKGIRYSRELGGQMVSGKIVSINRVTYEVEIIRDDGFTRVLVPKDEINKRLGRG